MLILTMTVFTDNAGFLICCAPASCMPAICCGHVYAASCCEPQILMAVQAALLDYAQSEVELRTARDSKRFNLASMPLNVTVTHF